MKPTNIIESISFFLKGKRCRLQVDKNGRFPIYTKKNTSPIADKYIGSRTAEEIIRGFLDGDPVIELEGGGRVRVCQGYSRKIRVEAISIVETHDSFHRKRVSKY